MANKVILDACIKQFSEQNGFDKLPEDEKFEYFCALQLTKNSETSFSEIENSVTDGGNDGGIDSFLVLVNDRCVSTLEDLNEVKVTERAHIEIFFIQSKTGESFKEAALDKLLASWPSIINLDLNTANLLTQFNPDLVEKIELFRAIWKESAVKRAELCIRVRYCTKADTTHVNGPLKHKKSQLEKNIKAAIPYADVDMQLLSASELLEIYQQKTIETLELPFSENPTPVSLTKDKYGYIGVVKIYDYIKFITDQESSQIRESIFESNIRHFLGEVDVNKKIADTLINDTQNDFWWFNNGITIIADTCSLLPKTLVLKNVKIINGLQTSFTIFENSVNITNVDPRTILVKVILASDKEVVDKIINASNYQNAVPPVLLRATDKIQRDIENYCLAEGFFYDRRKGFYRNSGRPATKIFTIQDMAQAIKTVIFHDPATARRNPTTIIKSDTSYNSIFDESKPFSSFLNSVLLVQRVRNFVAQNVTPELRGTMRNFTFHIARTLSAIIFKNPNYAHVEISKLDLTLITDELCKESWDLCYQYVVDFQDLTGDNIINIAKSQKFSDYLTERLLKKFATESV